jgi:hypothetical protein
VFGNSIFAHNPNFQTRSQAIKAAPRRREIIEFLAAQGITSAGNLLRRPSLRKLATIVPVALNTIIVFPGRMLGKYWLSWLADFR